METTPQVVIGIWILVAALIFAILWRTISWR